MTAHALIVSRNARTAESLRAYFDNGGVKATITDQIEAPANDAEFSALVVFPDEFPAHRAMDGLRKLASRFSRAWIFVVTRHTARFDELVAAINTPALSRLFVMPRPVWGWALLDRALLPMPHSTDG